VIARPRTKYATAADGSQIAYQVVGDGTTDLVYLTGSLSHVDVRWEQPAGARFLEQLASFARLIIFDRRGVGASDRLPIDVVPTWEEWALDLEVVLDATDSQSAALMAVADGGAMAITFAASYPERVRALVLFNGLGTSISSEDMDFIAEVQRQAWGTLDWVNVIAPSAVNDTIQSEWFAKYMRATGTPRAIAAQARATWSVNTDFVLPSVHVPTLVVHRRDRRDPTVGVARQLTDRIPNARFVDIPGTDLTPQTQEPDLVVAIVQEFLTGVRPPPKANRFLATVLFTDIVDSTRLAITIGDSAWRELLDAHDEMIRADLERCRGREVKTTGDGFLAIFDGPSRAIECALAIRDHARDIGVEVRAGLHTGEVEARDDDIGGIAVHIGARVAAAAHASEVLVSRTVADLVAGSAIAFVDRGEHELKGVPGTWRLLAVDSV
jgi:class 3 adenylate cyclase/pimeloyl-ACP methyl ester carboxylesterase